MSLIKNIKRIISLSLTSAVLLTTSLVFGNTVTASASVDPVKMYAADFNYEAGGGVHWYNADIYVKVSNSDQYYTSSPSQKQVYVHASISGGTWTDLPCTYVNSFSDGSQIWKVKTTLGMGDCIQYAIKYVVNGNTVWDNNNNQNYTQNNILGVATVRAVPPYYGGGYLYNLGVDVKPTTLGRSVKVRYTTNNWTTYTDQYLTDYTQNPDGSLRYTTTLELWNVDTTKFHYAVCDTVGSTQTWDNNFGQNYNFNN